MIAYPKRIRTIGKQQCDSTGKRAGIVWIAVKRIEAVTVESVKAIVAPDPYKAVSVGQNLKRSVARESFVAIEEFE
ncbi:hypothetical protein [Lysobacter antibioticus]|uniref:hypothetical protein n=1 Tax=Lysobacter antibioticus TaxID=84531 RepID=UPI0016513856|nr:hypothetical protein [Lysobacter antibioticus]